MTPRNMPASLRRVATLTSTEAAVELARNFGGRYLYVPGAPHKEHPIAQAVGFEAAKVLSAEWGSDYMYVPAARFLDRSRRDEAIRKAHAEGESVQFIADEYGISTRHVWRICSRSNA